jgi:hypothetical protein
LCIAFRTLFVYSVATGNAGNERTLTMHLNHNHPLVKASLLLSRAHTEAYQDKLRATSKRATARAHKSLDMITRVQFRLNMQIKDTPECWESQGVLYGL